MLRDLGVAVGPDKEWSALECGIWPTTGPHEAHWPPAQPARAVHGCEHYCRQARDQLDGHVTDSSVLRRGEGGGPKDRKGEGAAGDAAGAAPADSSLQGSASLALERRIELMDSMMQSMRVMDLLLVDMEGLHYQLFHTPSLNFDGQAFFTR